LLHLVGYLYYWQMGFNSVFKGLTCREIPKWFYGSEVWKLFKISVPVNRNAAFHSEDQTNRLDLLREVMAVCSQNPTKHTTVVLTTR